VVVIVLFSFFERKPVRKDLERRGAAPVGGEAGEPTRIRPAARSRLEAREQARRTIAKIDEIELQMIGRPASRPDVTLTVARREAEVAPAVHEREIAGVASAATTVTQSPSESRVGAPVAPEMPEALPDALEEAVVLYANGQTEAAVSVLLHAARQPGGKPFLWQTWIMLFDLYQATGQRDEFDALAIGFCARFAGSPPVWDEGRAPPRARPSQEVPEPIHVMLPRVLTAEADALLERVERWAGCGRSLVLDLFAVTVLDEGGAARLVHVLDRFEARSSSLYLPGAEQLLELGRAQIALGRKQDHDGIWRLCLTLLRVLGRHQAFEDLAIDYCVTFEVSPPAWCGAFAFLYPAAPLPVEVPSVPVAPSFEFKPEACVLRGTIDGRAHPLWSALRAYAQDRAEIVLDCQALRRMDFMAVGDLLNQIMVFREAGRYCVLKEVSHLVAGLFVVMGISSYADVRLRRV
jgi:anti-anti-sigma regulatory factor